MSRHTTSSHGNGVFPSQFLRLFPCVFGFSLMLAAAAHAADFYWTGNGNDGLWSTAANWDSPSQGTPAAAAPKGKTVSAQQYTQRDYTEEELSAVSGDLIEEARKQRG